MTINCEATVRPTFLPARRLISAITQTSPVQVTTTFAHNYTNGQIVRLIVPAVYGMKQIDGKKGIVTVTGDTTFTLPIDATTFTPFVDPGAGAPPHSNECASVIPVGEIASTLDGATQNVLPWLT